MAGWSLRSALSALERATGKKNGASLHDSSTQTKSNEQSEEFEVIADFEDSPSVDTARSRVWSGPSGSSHSGRTARSHRFLDEFGGVHIHRLHHDVSDGFLGAQVRGWFLHSNSRLGPQEAQPFCQRRPGTRDSAKYQRNCIHNGAMLIWPCRTDM